VKKERLHAEGAPSQAFQHLSDLCAENRVELLRTLFVRVEGSGATGARELKSVGLAIPQMGKGQYRLEQVLTCEFGVGEALVVNFSGSWDRYKRLKQVTDAFAGEAEKLHVELKLRADFPDGIDVTGPQFSTIRDVLAGMELGRVVLDAEQVPDTKVKP
jgi:hypothetical protein